MSYILVNPNINGTEFKSNKNKSSDAAKEIWSEFSANIKDYIPSFYFTIQNTEDNSLFHYNVKESLKEGNVKFSIKKFNNKNIDNKALIKSLQTGGKRRKHKKKDSSSSDSSSSSSSSSSEVFVGTIDSNNLLSINYAPGIYGVPNVLLPNCKLGLAYALNLGGKGGPLLFLNS